MVNPPLSAAIVYMENSMAGAPSFVAEQLLGVLGVPRYNLNNVWNPAITNHTGKRCTSHIPLPTWLRGCLPGWVPACLMMMAKFA